MTIGIECVCGVDEFKTLETRAANNAVKRRKECTGCGRRITTWERAANGKLAEEQGRARQGVPAAQAARERDETMGAVVFQN